MSHLKDLCNLLSILKDNKVRYVCIRGFLKLPVTADTDLDIVVHRDDFTKANELAKLILEDIGKHHSETISNVICTYIPYKTRGELDPKMSNGCFRIDIYNDFFFHLGGVKYIIPRSLHDIVFDTSHTYTFDAKYNLCIPMPEIEFLLILCRTIFDRNCRPMPEKHRTRLLQLYELMKNNIYIVRTFFNVLCVYDITGTILNKTADVLREINLHYLFAKNDTEPDIDEPQIFTFNKISLSLLQHVGWRNYVNQHYCFPPIKIAPEYLYLQNKKSQYKTHPITAGAVPRYDKLISDFPSFTANWKLETSFPKIAPDWRTPFRGVRFDPYYQKYEAYIYKNEECISLGYFSYPFDAAKKYDSEAKLYHGYTAICNFNGNKLNNLNGLNDRRNGVFQVRDGKHRFALSTFHNYANIPVNLVLNKGRRPSNKMNPLEREFHTLIIWQSDKNLEEKLLLQLGQLYYMEIIDSITLSINSGSAERLKFVQDVYSKELQFYGQGNIAVNDPRVSGIINPNIKIYILCDYLPIYVDHTKQNKRLPVNKRLFDIKRALRATYYPKDFHTSDNATESDQVINAVCNLKNEKRQSLNIFLNCS